MNNAGNVYLSLGSNEGDRLFNLYRAVELINANRKIRVTATSSIYETEPVGYIEQAWFLNAVAEIESSLNPFEMLRFVKKIEERMGREQTFRWGPRVIDIDIVVYGSEIINDPSLTIPHPEMQRRKFVLIPLCEINPHFIHPIFNQTVNRLLKQCPDDQIAWYAPFQQNEN
ncbi:2-amino-4-hydroxy-6-hydroxymethyldihydropteridine diphosphokinase [candidate division KSB1 bacterium]|nr:2-amino-4-hydroxy-6-hydroxymethyldihydropteridine diphosphokinase [candidate division KSB1 bacterium]